MAASPDPLLVQHLARSDERCPSCRYVLRGCPSDRCPECGRALRLALATDAARGSWLWLIAVGGYGLATLLATVLLLDLFTPVESLFGLQRQRALIAAGMAPATMPTSAPRLIVATAITLASWSATAGLVVHRRRFPLLPGWIRLVTVVAGAAAPFAVIVVTTYVLNRL